MQRLNVVLDPLDELCLVLPDRPSDVGTHKESVVAGEDAEHLVGALGSAQLVPQTSSYARLNSIDALVVPGVKTSARITVKISGLHNNMGIRASCYGNLFKLHCTSITMKMT